MILSLTEAKEKLLGGEVLICPTETVYGLAILEKYRDKLDLIKRQSTSKPLARVYASAEPILVLIKDVFLRQVVTKLLPGPFTLLLNTPEATGFRVPEHPVWSELLLGVDEIVLMTSANIHTEKPACNFQEAKAIFPDLEGIDGGQSYYNRPSMLIDLTSGLR